MKIAPVTLLLTVLLALPLSAAAQELSQAADSLSLVAAGTEAGLRAGRTASVRGARWRSAAATFFLTPFVGGVGSLLSAQLASGMPSEVPQTVPEAAHPVYQEAYREAYRTSYRPRFRRAIRTSVLVTSVVFFAGAAAFAG